MHAAGLIVDINNATTDHYADEHRQRTSRAKDTSYIDVGIKLDDLKLNLLDHARLYLRLIERRHQLGHLIHKGRGHEIVSVIEHQADVGRVCS